MSAADILEILITANISAGVVIAALILIRNPLRRLVGAQATYWSWLIVPLVVLASLAPARIVSIDVASAADVATRYVSEPAATEAPSPMSAAPSAYGVEPPLSAEVRELPAAAVMDWALPLVVVWIVVALGALTWLLLRQHFAMRALGTLTRISPRIFRSGHADFGPVVVGVLSPRLVLPVDFEAAFDETERKVVIAHEEAHLHGRHTFVRAVMQIAVCLNWFNPLVNLAARCIAMDQELTSDAAVVRRYPEHRRAYANVLMKHQISLRAPMACHWPAASKDALKVRITEIKRRAPSAHRRAAGVGVLTVAAACVAGVAWATKPPETRFVASASEQAAGTSQTDFNPYTQPPSDLNPLKPVRLEPEAPEDASRPQRLEPHALSTMPFVLVGNVEKLEFRERDYVMFVRGSYLAMPNYKNTTWGSQAAPGIWELSPINYFGDAAARRAVTSQFLNKEVRATGVSATPVFCKPDCRMQADNIERVEATLLPALSSNASFSLTDLAMQYDVNNVATFRGKVERIEFSDRMFDAYVRGEPRGGAAGALYQIRAESRFPVDQVKRLLLDKTIVAAGWPGRTKDDTVCETQCGLYATDIELSDQSKLTPNGATLVSRRPANAEFHDEPGALPTIMPGLFERIDLMGAFDLSDPIILEGVVVGRTSAELLVEARSVYPNSTNGALSGTMWRVLNQSGSGLSAENEVGRTIVVRGFNSRTKSCQPSCVMSDGPSW